MWLFCDMIRIKRLNEFSFWGLNSTKYRFPLAFYKGALLGKATKFYKRRMRRISPPTDFLLRRLSGNSPNRQGRLTILEIQMSFLEQMIEAAVWQAVGASCP
jgi:hypothetical protein